LENINDLIYAYSLGCLDKEELERLKSLNNGEEELNFKELGEFQNLVSLLPSTLTLETPDPQLKDNVAKKLYRLKDEIKAQRQKNKPIANIQETQEITEPDSTLKESELQPAENKAFHDNQIDDNDAQRFVEGTLDLASNQNLPSSLPTIPVKKKNNFNTWAVVLIFILIVGFVIAYLKFSLATNNLNNEVDKLKKEVGDLNIKLIGNQEIQEMLQSPEVHVINLKGTDLSPNSFGKLIIGSDRGTGYIQFSQMPAISEDKLFQLWAGISGEYIKLKTFQASDTMGFYSFKIQNLPKGDDINFLVSEEVSSGSMTPTNKIYLRGIFTP
jgi:hypothetical protein